MNRKELLTTVKEEAGLERLKQADGAVRVIVGVLKTLLSEDMAKSVEESLPKDLRKGWKVVEPFPTDILEREDYYYDGGQATLQRETPTITPG
jgi:uncharacterized protein (DUF2267 family)